MVLRRDHVRPQPNPLMISFLCPCAANAASPGSRPAKKASNEKIIRTLIARKSSGNVGCGIWRVVGIFGVVDPIMPTHLEDIAGLGGHSGGGGLAAVMAIPPQIVHKCHHEYSYRDGHTNNYDGQDTADNHRRQCECYIVVCLSLFA